MDNMKILVGPRGGKYYIATTKYGKKYNVYVKDGALPTKNEKYYIKPVTTSHEIEHLADWSRVYRKPKNIKKRDDSVIVSAPNMREIVIGEPCEPNRRDNDIDGWYMTSNILGAAGSAFVYTACDQYDKCNYAAKSGDVSKDEIELQNICAAYGLCKNVEIAWVCPNHHGVMITEKLDKTFGELLETQRYHNYDVEEKLNIIKDSLSLVCKLHVDALIFHGDLHGENIMADESQKTWIIDLGAGGEISYEYMGLQELMSITGDYAGIAMAFRQEERLNPVVLQMIDVASMLPDYMLRYWIKNKVSFDVAERVVVDAFNRSTICDLERMSSENKIIRRKYTDMDRLSLIKYITFFMDKRIE